MGTTTNTLRKIIGAFQSEQKALSRSFLVSKYNINNASAADGLEFLEEIGVVQRIKASTQGILYVWTNRLNKDIIG